MGRCAGWCSSAAGRWRRLEDPLALLLLLPCWVRGLAALGSRLWLALPMVSCMVGQGFTEYGI